MTDRPLNEKQTKLLNDLLGATELEVSLYEVDLRVFRVLERRGLAETYMGRDRGWKVRATRKEV